MDPRRWQMVEHAFQESLRLAPGNRASFLQGCCEGDGELRGEVMSLLAAHAALGNWLETPAVCEEGPDVATFAPGRRIGAYLLERELGHGGMGTVFLASRADQQFEKLVAIKMVREGLTGEHFENSFRHERQILATLEHPNIAMLLDGGIEGRPYLVMEYVDGVPVDVYCDSHRLPLRARLQMFLKVCAAVHHAHQHLVVHRDLKPSNILVTAEGEPKLLDFGVATILHAAPRPSFVLATREYASPELLQGEPVTTATDVYSLGIILRLLVKSEAALRSDLRSIVDKTVNPDPAARYSSPALLSEDIARYLDGRPVRAHQGGVDYKAAMFLRRNRVISISALTVMLALLGATVVSVHQSRVAERERRLSNQRLEQLRGLTSTMLFEFHDAIQPLPGSTPARRMLVQRTLEFLGSLDAASAREPAQRHQLAEAYRKVGDVQGNPSNANLGDTAGALASYRKALPLARELVANEPGNLSFRRSLALVLQKMADTDAQAGNVAEAVAAMRESLNLFVELAAKDKSLEAQQQAGTAHIKMGDLLGHPSFPNVNDPAGALTQYHEALAIYASLRPADNAINRRYLGLLHERVGKMQELAGQAAAAWTSYQQSFEIRRSLAEAFPANTNARRDLAIAEEKIGDILLSKGDSKEAMRHYRATLPIFQSLYTLDPSNANAARTLAVEHEKLGEYSEALRIQQRLAVTDPVNSRIREDVARLKSRLAAER